MKKSSLWTNSVALGILVVASVIGNVSMSAAGGTRLELPVAKSVPNGAESAAPFARSTAYGGLVATATDVVQAMDVSDDVVPAADGDATQVVPAIYAWDPDVKFVFYRHVSKWM